MFPLLPALEPGQSQTWRLFVPTDSNALFIVVSAVNGKVYSTQNVQQKCEACVRFPIAHACLAGGVAALTLRTDFLMHFRKDECVCVSVYLHCSALIKLYQIKGKSNRNLKLQTQSYYHFAYY